MVEANLSLGERLRLAVHALSMTQKEFSSRSGIVESTLSGIIAAGKKPTADTLVKIYDMGININWVVSGNGPMLLSETGVSDKHVNKVSDDSAGYTAHEQGSVKNILSQIFQLDDESIRQIYEILKRHLSD